MLSVSKETTQTGNIYCVKGSKCVFDANIKEHLFIHTFPYYTKIYMISKLSVTKHKITWCTLYKRQTNLSGSKKLTMLYTLWVQCIKMHCFDWFSVAYVDSIRLFHRSHFNVMLSKCIDLM